MKFNKIFVILSLNALALYCAQKPEVVPDLAETRRWAEAQWPHTVLMQMGIKVSGKEKISHWFLPTYGDNFHIKVADIKSAMIHGYDEPKFADAFVLFNGRLYYGEKNISCWELRQTKCDPIVFHPTPQFWKANENLRDAEKKVAQAAQVFKQEILDAANK